MKRIAILQPGYLPWLGFFEQIAKSDIFVYLDDVQYTKNDWRNRNRIKIKGGFQWVTVPITFHLGQKIVEVPIDNTIRWGKKHLQALATWYGKSPYYKSYISELESILSRDWSLIRNLDLVVSEWFMDRLGIRTETVCSSELDLQEQDRQLRLIEICKKLGADTFYEGKSGRDYISPLLFLSHGVEVEFQDYQHPIYNQLWGEFLPYMSAIDLLLNHGPDSLDILLGRMVI